MGHGVVVCVVMGLWCMQSWICGKCSHEAVELSWRLCCMWSRGCVVCSHGAVLYVVMGSVLYVGHGVVVCVVMGLWCM